MWKEYLSFSKSERITFLSLTVLIVLLLILSCGIKAIKFSDAPNSLDEVMIREFYNSLNDSIDSVNNERVNMARHYSSYRVKNKSPQFNDRISKFPKRKEFPPESKTRDVMQIEINRADTAIFALLPGVGHVISSRIVRYRNSLKGFYVKDQLLEVYGVDSLLYTKISPYLVVDSIYLEQLNLNQISIARMKNHPYLSFYQAKEIYEQRVKFGNFKSINDILALNSFKDTNSERLVRYFCVK